MNTDRQKNNIDMLFFRLVEGRQVKERKIPFVFDSKKEWFFSPLLHVIFWDYVICIEYFLPGNAGEYDPSFNAFYVSYLTHWFQPGRSEAILCLAWAKWCLGTLMVIEIVFKKYWKRWVCTRTQVKLNIYSKKTHCLCGERILLNTLQQLQ